MITKESAIFQLTRQAGLHNGNINATNFFLGFLAFYHKNEFDETGKNPLHPNNMTKEECLERVQYFLSRPLSIGSIFNMVHLLFEAYKKKKAEEMSESDSMKAVSDSIKRKIKFIKKQYEENV